jgi:hypothetical protein
MSKNKNHHYVSYCYQKNFFKEEDRKYYELIKSKNQLTGKILGEGEKRGQLNTQFSLDELNTMTVEDKQSGSNIIYVKSENHTKEETKFAKKETNVGIELRHLIKNLDDAGDEYVDYLIREKETVYKTFVDIIDLLFSMNYQRKVEAENIIKQGISGIVGQINNIKLSKNNNNRDVINIVRFNLNKVPEQFERIHNWLVLKSDCDSICYGDEPCSFCYVRGNSHVLFPLNYRYFVIGYDEYYNDIDCVLLLNYYYQKQKIICRRDYDWFSRCITNFSSVKLINC